MKLTLWQSFAQTWSKGCGSDQCSQAHRVVLARGCVPADIIIVGEAPGESEDSTGEPFIGPAGHLLDYITSHSIPQHIPEWRLPLPHPLPQRKVRVAWTNLVGCIPREGVSKAGAPDEDQIEACSRRLVDFIILCNPALIICVGTLARDRLDNKHSRSAKIYWRHINGALDHLIRVCHIVHPAWILRQNNALQSLWKRRCIIAIADTCQEVFESKTKDCEHSDEVPF